MTPAESRQKLSVLRDRAISAGLIDFVRDVDILLLLVPAMEVVALEKALAEAPLAAVSADIVAQPDTPDPEPASVIPAPRSPVVAPSHARALPRGKVSTRTMLARPMQNPIFDILPPA